MSIDDVVLKVAVFDGVDIEVLRQQATDLPTHVQIVYEAIPKSYGKEKQDELAQLMQGYDGAVVRSKTKFSKAIEQLPSLKFIARAGVGVANIDNLLAAKNKTIVF